MMKPVTIALRERRLSLAEAGSPLALERLLPLSGPWEVEVGFGKGRYLLESAATKSDHRFLGIERASKYFRLVERRAKQRGLSNVLLAHGEALFLLSAVLPPRFARVVHVYFPDPWPKNRHHKRRLFDHGSVDLVLRLLSPGGVLCFATDCLDYAERVAALLESHPKLAVEELDSWPEGPRTNYEIKYEAQGRRIVRLEARLLDVGETLLHPQGARRVTAAVGGTAR